MVLSGSRENHQREDRGCLSHPLFQHPGSFKDGKRFQGHLYTTVLYVEGEDTNQKVVLFAKQTGVNNQKLTDLIYPTRISFTAPATAPSSLEINLAQTNLRGIKRLLVVFQTGLATVGGEGNYSGESPLVSSLG